MSRRRASGQGGRSRNGRGSAGAADRQGSGGHHGTPARPADGHASPYPRSARRAPLPAGFGVVWATVAIDLIGFGMAVPFLARYAEGLGGSPAQAGVVVAAFSGAQCAFAVVGVALVTTQATAVAPAVTRLGPARAARTALIALAAGMILLVPAGWPFQVAALALLVAGQGVFAPTVANRSRRCPPRHVDDDPA